MENKQKIQSQLNKNFGSQLDHEIIKTVLQSCNWNKITAIQILNDMLGNTFDDYSNNDSGWHLAQTPRRCGKNDKKSKQFSQQSRKSEDVFMKNGKGCAVPQSSKILILLRGLPGSGKSTLARDLIKETGVVNSADDFFYDHRGYYNYNSYAIQDAHAWNKKRTDRCMRDGISPIVIDNTNIEVWEMRPYALMALRYFYEIKILEPDTPWKFKPRELAKKNCHNVCKQKIEDMLSRYDHNITVKNILPSEYRKGKSQDKSNELCRSNFKKLKVNKGCTNMQNGTDFQNSNNTVNCNFKMPNVDGNDLAIAQTDALQTERKQRTNIKRTGNLEKWSNLLEVENNIMDSWESDSFAGTSWGLEPEETCPAMEHINKTTQTSHEESSFHSEQEVVYGKGSRFIVAQIESTAFPLRGVPKFDVGCMTEEITNNGTSQMAIKQLSLAFNSCEKEELTDVLEKCNYDIDWAVNILMDSGYAMSSSFDAGVTSIDVSSNIKQEDVSDYNVSSCVSNSNDSQEIEIQSTEHANLDSKTSCKNNNEQSSNISCNFANNSTPQLKSESEIAISLDEDSAKKLIDLFGPIGIVGEGNKIAKDYRSVNLPIELCEILHQFWARTVETKFLNGNIESENNEVPFNDIVDMEMPFNKMCANNERNNNDPFVVEPPESFREIMEVEQAVEDSLKSNSHGLSTLSSFLTLNKLKQQFPHVNPIAVKTHYMQNSCSYDKTQLHLAVIYGGRQDNSFLKPDLTGDANQENESHISFKSIEDCRKDAAMHGDKRQHALHSVQDSIRRKMYPVASHYSQVASYHSRKQREANKNAANQIMTRCSKKNNTLDLHNLHVTEAVTATQVFLSQKLKYLANRQLAQTEVLLVTGYGKNSYHLARIKPTIVKYLRSLDYNFFEDPTNEGMLHVTLRL